VFAETFQQADFKDVLEIKDLKFDVFQELLRFIYAGKVTNLDQIAFDLIPAADKVRFLETF
jgi:hypothetical protein